MNDKELNKNVKKSLENFIKELATNPEKVFDNDKLQIKYNKVLKEKIKLQSNWNSLREWLEQQKEDSKICKEWNNKKGFNDIDYERDIKRFDFVLDKMNELEKGDRN